MRLVAALFVITTTDVLLQLSLGGLLTFNFIDPHVHIVSGFVLFFLTIATMVASIASKPRPRSLLATSFALVLLVILQALLGFDTLDTGNQAIAWVHFIIAMAIYGTAISGTFIAIRASQIKRVQPTA